MSDTNQRLAPPPPHGIYVEREEPSPEEQLTTPSQPPTDEPLEEVQGEAPEDPSPTEEKQEEKQEESVEAKPTPRIHKERIRRERTILEEVLLTLLCVIVFPLGPIIFRSKRI